MPDVRTRLWNGDVGPDTYTDGAVANYQSAVMEQYKVYVEMTDRISQRRGLTNTFFLTLNTAIFTLVGIFWKDQPRGPKWALAFPLVIALGQCFAWFYLVRSYRQVNTAKFQVIGALEERLPASPYWRAEWTALGEGNDRTKYWPLSHVEKWIPILFGATYLSAFLAALLA
ncbi:MAG: RipA family octameric membrane protein [Acidimicrobiales bacterium]